MSVLGVHPPVTTTAGPDTEPLLVTGGAETVKLAPVHRSSDLWGPADWTKADVLAAARNLVVALERDARILAGHE